MFMGKLKGKKHFSYYVQNYEILISTNHSTKVPHFQSAYDSSLDYIMYDNDEQYFGEVKAF